MITKYPDQSVYNHDYHLEHLQGFTGEIVYVMKVGSDDNSGHSPHIPKLTIGAAITASADYGIIVVGPGTYEENGLDLDHTGLELHGEIGAMINNASGTCLTVSANSCRVSGIKLQQLGKIGLALTTGNGCLIEDVIVEDCTIAFDVNSSGNILQRCQDKNATVTGYDIASAENVLFLCNSIASGGSSRGFYLSSSSANENMIYQCLSTGNNTAGYEVVADAAYNVFAYCSSGGGDGKRVDEGTKTQWAAFIGVLPREKHEEIYPACAGEGVAAAPITVTNMAQDETGSQDDQWYYGEPFVLVPPATLTDIWTLHGYNIFATTANKEMQGCLYRINNGQQSDKNGGNAWDEGATVLTVDDGSKFAANDLVWIDSDYKTNGEIVKVSSVSTNEVTIARETVASARTGLRWNHTTNNAGTEVMYRLYRSTTAEMHPTCINHSAASAKDFQAGYFHEPREFRASDGLLIRILNMSDDLACTFDMTIVYRD